MSRGRPRKYETTQVAAEANKQRSNVWYSRHKDEMQQKRYLAIYGPDPLLAHCGHWWPILALCVCGVCGHEWEHAGTSCEVV